MKVSVVYQEKHYQLSAKKPLTVGRVGHHSDIELEGSNISRKHAEVSLVYDQAFVKDTKSLLGLELNGNRIDTDANIKLEHGDTISISGHKLFIHVVEAPVNDENLKINSTSKKEVKKPKADLKELLRQKKKITIGRNQDNDIVIQDKTISRLHAQIIQESGSYWVEDLNSKNGVFLHGKKIVKKEKFDEKDEIIISLTSISLIYGIEDLRKNKSAISAKQVSRIYSNGRGLQPISLKIAEGDFVALMGPSGCGKSTLLKSLSNVAPPFKGEVKIHGLDTKTHFDLLKTKIGYVPQDDIIHEDLSVYNTLFFAAKLRLANDTSDEEIEDKIDEVLFNLNLESSDKFKATLVRDLSGGQRKRISIAVELLNNPTILFLDEPTSPLDPETIDSFLGSIKKLTESGTTILMVTHKPEDLNYSDKVIFFMIQGYIAYFGEPERIYDQFKVDDIIKVYSLLSDESSLENNVKNYYIKTSDGRDNPSLENKQFGKDKKSLFSQWYWLTKRYSRIKITDKSNLSLLLAQPIIIAVLVGIIFEELQVGVLFLMSISAIWFGVSNSAKEIVSELVIYTRERMINLNIHAYILSKMTVLSVIALLQTFIFVTILYLKFKLLPDDHESSEIYLKSFLGSFASMAYLAISASLIGLLLSSHFKTTERVMTVVPIALMPQIMLSGVITKIDNALIEILSYFTIGRWGTEVLGRVQDEEYERIMIEGTQQLDPNSGSVLSMAMNAEGKTRFQPFFAEDILNYYPEDSIGKGLDSLSINLIIILGLNIVLYTLIYISLKKKDIS